MSKIVALTIFCLPLMNTPQCKQNTEYLLSNFKLDYRKIETRLSPKFGVSRGGWADESGRQEVRRGEEIVEVTEGLPVKPQRRVVIHG